MRNFATSEYVLYEIDLLLILVCFYASQYIDFLFSISDDVFCETSWISASHQVNSALFFNSCYFHNVHFFHCGMPPLCPGIGGTMQIWVAREKNFPALVPTTSKSCWRLCYITQLSLSAALQNIQYSYLLLSFLPVTYWHNYYSLWLLQVWLGPSEVLQRRTFRIAGARLLLFRPDAIPVTQWYGIVEFNVPLDTV